MSSSIATIGDVCEVSTGQSAPQKSDAFSDNGYPFIRAGSLNHLIKGGSENALEKINDENARRFKMRLFPPSTIVFAKSGMSATLGRVYKLKKPCYVVSHLATLIPSSRLDSNFLLRWLERNPPSHLIANKAYPSIKTSEIQKTWIPLPSITEQSRIAAILDKADTIRKKRRESLKLADEFLRSVFLNMFGDPATNPKGWPVYSLGSLCTVQTGATPNRDKASYYGGRIPWVKTGEVDQDLILDTEERITESGIKETNCKIFPVETILIAMYGQGKTRGKCGMLGISAATNQACAAILPTNSINGAYLYRLLKASYEGIRGMGRGGNQENLNLGMIKGLDIIVPPEALQKQFAEIVKRTAHIKTMQQTLLADTELLFVLISRMAFSGQL